MAVDRPNFCLSVALSAIGRLQIPGNFCQIVAESAFLLSLAIRLRTDEFEMRRMGTVGGG